LITLNIGGKKITSDLLAIGGQCCGCLNRQVRDDHEDEEVGEMGCIGRQ
jgi:hypothetical protein